MTHEPEGRGHGPAGAREFPPEGAAAYPAQPGAALFPPKAAYTTRVLLLYVAENPKWAGPEFLNLRIKALRLIRRTSLKPAYCAACARRTDFTYLKVISSGLSPGRHGNGWNGKREKSLARAAGAGQQGGPVLQRH